MSEISAIGFNFSRFEAIFKCTVLDSQKLSKLIRIVEEGPQLGKLWHALTSLEREGSKTADCSVVVDSCVYMCVFIHVCFYMKLCCMCKYDSLLLAPNFSKHLKPCIIYSKDT